MKCRSGVNKVSWVDRTGTVLCRLAGKSGQGRVFLLARHGPLHNFAIFVVLNFERGERLETSSDYIYSLLLRFPWYHTPISSVPTQVFLVPTPVSLVFLLQFSSLTPRVFLVPTPVSLAPTPDSLITYSGFLGTYSGFLGSLLWFP